ncbi:hypothetical protein Tsubulata_046142 [Turnera subulata]|uniref:F-box associated beta-propeller type 3 domain-containing protein n=1 Tax=Turnera subulata TaxID=218843 RepID=A0A9Q0F3H0_9ROSI|nr:hypothetical protein Tsubulata_046142 [Turnera subulata]
MDDSPPTYVRGSRKVMSKRQHICRARTTTSCPSLSKSKTERAREDDDKEVASHLPMDIVSSPILNRLPPSFLYESCSDAVWGSFAIRSVGIKDLNDIHVSDLNLLFPGSIISSSDGVVLIWKYSTELYVANPVTRQIVELPLPITRQIVELPLPITRQIVGLPFPHNSGLFPSFSGIARIPSTGELKVVVLTEFPQELFVLTVGDGMRWRKLSFPPGIRIKQKMGNGVCTVAGVVYSTTERESVYDSISAVDLRDESVHNVMLPEKSEFWEKAETIVCSRDNLFLMDAEPIRNKKFLRLWLLKDLHRGEWVRLRNLNLSRIPYPEPEIFPTPLVWLKSEQVLVVQHQRMDLKGLEDDDTAESSPNVYVVVAYFLRSGKCKLLAKCGDDETLPLWHIDSLVRF